MGSGTKDTKDVRAMMTRQLSWQSNSLLRNGPLVRIQHGSPPKLKWPLHLTVRIPPFHGGYRGSNPLGVTTLLGSFIILVAQLSWQSATLTRWMSQVRALQRPPFLHFCGLYETFIQVLSLERQFSWLEYLPVTQGVAGSSPVRSAT